MLPVKGVCLQSSTLVLSQPLMLALFLVVVSSLDVSPLSPAAPIQFGGRLDEKVVLQLLPCPAVVNLALRLACLSAVTLAEKESFVARRAWT